MKNLHCLGISDDGYRDIVNWLGDSPTAFETLTTEQRDALVTNAVFDYLTTGAKEYAVAMRSQQLREQQDAERQAEIQGIEAYANARIEAERASVVMRIEHMPQPQGEPQGEPDAT